MTLGLLIGDVDLRQPVCKIKNGGYAMKNKILAAFLSIILLTWGAYAGTNKANWGDDVYIDSSGVIYAGQGMSIADDEDLIFGTGSDWKVQYDEGVDNQLLFITANTSCTATTDPMVEFIVGATPTANQQVFGLSKGTQASNTPLFTVDEDGDMIVAGTSTLTGEVTITSSLKTPVKTLTATTTLTANESMELIALNSATEFVTTLPAVASSAGVTFHIVVRAAPSGASYTVVTNGGENKIYGMAEVNGAAVAAVAEDTITFTDGAAAIGDWIELTSDGTNWYVSGQGVAATAIAFSAT